MPMTSQPAPRMFARWPYDSMKPCWMVWVAMSSGKLFVRRRVGTRVPGEGRTGGDDRQGEGGDHGQSREGSARAAGGSMAGHEMDVHGSGHFGEVVAGFPAGLHRTGHRSR